MAYCKYPAKVKKRLNREMGAVKIVIRERSNFNEIIKDFSPAWFAVVMGTGGLANLLYLLSPNLSFLKPIAQFLFWLNILLFILLLVPWVLRWFIHFKNLLLDLRHPMMSNFFVTMPAAMVILGTNFFIIGKGYFTDGFIDGLGLAFWIAGGILTLAISVFVMFNIFSQQNIDLEHVNFSWFIPPVVGAVLPLLGKWLVNSYLVTNIGLARIINLVDLIYYGTAITLFILLAGILLNRFIFNKMPKDTLLPTFWIILSPIGLGSLALMDLSDTAKLLNLVASVDALKLIAIIFWGFGLWALLLTLVITFYYLSRGKIPFTLSWWALIFPLAAYALASNSIYNYTKIELVYWYTLFLAVLLTFLWLLTLVNTLIGITNGKILYPSKVDDT
jgi:C4-dicarboxylate transporter/malic acid transport protein